MRPSRPKSDGSSRAEQVRQRRAQRSARNATMIQERLTQPDGSRPHIISRIVPPGRPRPAGELPANGGMTRRPATRASRPLVEQKPASGGRPSYSIPADQRKRASVRKASSAPVFTRRNFYQMGGIFRQEVQPFGAPVFTRARSQVRRRFSIPLGGEGVEMEIPALPILRPGWRLLSGVLLAALLVGLYFVCTAPQFRINRPAIRGLQRVTLNDVEAVLNLNDLPIFMFNPQYARQRLESSFPELADISIRTSLPNRVAILARERQPVLAWQKGKKVYWIDSEGVMFSPRGELEQPLLTIRSEESPPLLAEPVEETVSSVAPAKAPAPVTPTPAVLGLSESELDTLADQPASLLPQVRRPKRMDPGFITAIQQLGMVVPPGTILVYDHQNGLGWQAPEGWQVYLGPNLDNLETKLLIYQAIVKTLKEKGIRPSMVSVAFPDAPYYLP